MNFIFYQWSQSVSENTSGLNLKSGPCVVLRSCRLSFTWSPHVHVSTACSCRQSAAVTELLLAAVSDRHRKL